MKLFYPGCKLLLQLTTVLLIITNVVYSQTTTAFSFTSIPYSDPDFIGPGRGAEQWHNSSARIPNPTESQPVSQETSLDAYYRFQWALIEGSTQGSYNWGYFDNLIRSAIDRGQKFSFGIMTHNSDGGVVSYGGGSSSYPQYLHNLMQAEDANSRDWLSSAGVWVPNWNSPNYLGRLRALHEALNNYILTASYTPGTGPHSGKRVYYRDVIFCIDIRGYGNWGEWHSGGICDFNSYPTGRQPTNATFKTLIDIHTQVFQNWPLVMMVAGYDGGYTGISLFGVPAEVSYYALTARNAWGAVGYRRDQWGATDGYLYNLMAGNNQTYNGSAPFKTYILEKYKYAPITGEPYPGNLDMADLENQVNLYHATSVGNGNYGAYPSSLTTRDRIRAAFKKAGYRIELNGGSAVAGSSSFTVNLNWRNVGVAPTYEDWRVTYELRNGSTVVWSGNSTFKPKLFLPSTNATVATDVFSRSGIPQGTYSLYVIVKDTAGYRSPLPLAITGRGSDGAYLLSNNVSIPAAGSNQVPVANAGSNQTITLPTSSVSLNGSASSDADGTIASYQWQQVSGPSASTLSATNTANITVSNLQAGVYTYRLTVTDNGNATATATVTVTVNNAVANLAPVANAGSNKTITLPTSSATLSGSASTDSDGTIASYLWQQVSGPSASTLSATNTAGITVTNLQAGVYSYRLTVTDNDNATATDTVTVTVNNAVVNQAPVANAGSNKTITLPTSSATLSGSTSTDPDGTIASYLWQQVSGPSASTLSTTNTAGITVSNLQAGVYSYKLTVRDNDNATATDTVTVTVNNAVANQAPIADAGSNKTITLPTSTTTLSGSASTDPDGTIASYQWEQESGPSTSTLSATNTVNITVSNLQAGTYTYRLTVTDNDGASDNVTVTVTVNNAPVNLAPVANAGANRAITLPTSSVTLSGSGTDADGTISGYQWQQVSGPSASTLSATNTANITVSDLLVGVYTYRLTVRDNDGATGTDEVTITVNSAPNEVPVANAGLNRTITLPTSSTTLSGSGTDGDGTIASYLWRQITGPSASTLSSANTASITVSNLLAGIYTYRLTVTDNDGSTDTDDVTVTVNNAPPNEAPTANAGANKTITLPTTSTALSGSGSTDADGTIVSYLWQQVSGPTTSALSATTTANITVSNLQPGLYTYRLTVRDNDNSTDTDDVTVTVNNIAVNQVPNANAGANIRITLPTNSTTLSGTGSTDADGTITSYQWQQVSGPSASTLSSVNTVNITVSNLQAGVYTYRLTATDNDGASDTDDVTVTVNARANQSPNAKAGGNRSITLPANSTSLSGAASEDADGTIVSYQWQQVDGPAGATFSATNTANINVSNLKAGVYTFRLTVTDDDNATGIDEVTVTVNSLPNEAPIANAGTNLVITLPANTASLRGSGIDADGTIAGYQWQQISGPSTSVLSATNTANITVSSLQAGVYIYRLTVRDNDNATGTDNITVTVNNAPPNQAPVANAGANKVITLPATSTSLSGSASTDPDGTIASYLWQQISGPSASALSATNTASITVSNLQVGKYTYRLTVRDNNNATATATVTVTVNNVPNKAPIAKTGPDQILMITANTTTLTAEQSSDPDGKIVSYKWQQVSGPSASTLSSASDTSITVSNLQAGDYVYRVTVTDDDKATDTATVKVAVIDNFRSYDKPFALYPNPAQDIINIHLLSDKASRSQINIYDMSGKQVLDPAIVNKPAGAFTTSIDVSRLKPGTYVVYITAFGVKKMTAKFLKL